MLGYAKQKVGLREGTFAIQGLQPPMAELSQRESAKCLLAGGVPYVKQGVRWASMTARDVTSTFATLPVAFPSVSRVSRYLQFPNLLKTLQSQRVREGYAKGNAKGLFSEKARA